MKQRSRQSVDGFIPRRPGGAPLNRYQEMTAESKSLRTTKSSLSDNELELEKSAPLERSKEGGLTRTDIDEFLSEIDEQDIEPKKTAKKTSFLKRIKFRKVLKRLVIFIAIVGILIGGWLGYKAIRNMNSVFGGGIMGLVKKDPLKQDENGRSNVLVFATSEDSPDHNANGGEGGPLLTDSIMVLSVNQESKDAFMVSIPRDLWVEFDEPCSVGWQEKINSVYQCGSNFGENPEAGAKALQKKVGEILGLDIQYYGQIDYSVVTRAVDAVGGVDVKIESNPPGVGILDRNFDWKCNYQCHYVKYDDGEVAHLDGEHALALARARNAQGGYGLAAGNFDREKNQQKIIKALRDKALSLGTLANVGKVTELLDAMGDNLKTNVEKSEIQTIISLAGEISNDLIMSLDLNNPEAPLVRNGNVGAASVVVPVAGTFEYGQIHEFIKKASSSDPVVREGATIQVLNGSGTVGAAQAESDWLENEGISVSEIGNAPAGSYPATRIYQSSEGMSATKSKLESIYGVTAEAPPAGMYAGADFVIILGENSPTRAPSSQMVQ